MGPDSVQWTSVEVTGWPPNFECQHKHRNLLFLRRHPADFPKEPLRSRAARSGASTDKIVIGDYESPPEQFGGHVWNEAPLFYLSLFIFLFPPPYGLLSVSDAACYASCWTKMTIDCSATAFVIRLGWILHLNHFIIYVPNSCQCHLEAGWLVIHHTLSFTVVINIVMGWTFTMKLPGEGNVDLLREGQATQNKLCVPVTT